MIGMTSVTFRKKSVEEVIEICKTAGIDCIEWGGDVHVPSHDIENAERVYRLTKEAGLEVSSYGSYFWVGKDSMEEFMYVLATAEILHAKYIRVWIGEVGSANTDEAMFEKYVKELKEMASAAEAKGIIVAAEFHNKTYNDSAETALKLIEAVDSPSYRTYWQTITYDERDEKYLSMLEGNIVNAHVFTWNKYGKRYKLAKKKKMWDNYIAMHGKDKLYTIEFVKGDKDKSFLRDVAALRDMLA